MKYVAVVRLRLDEESFGKAVDSAQTVAQKICDESFCADAAELVLVKLEDPR